MMYLCKVTPSAPASRAVPSLPPPPTLPPLRQQDQPLLSLLLLLVPLNMKTTRMKTSMMTHLHLMSSKSSSCHTVDKLTDGMCVHVVV